MRFKLTPVGRVVVFVVILAIIAAGGFFAYKTLFADGDVSLPFGGDDDSSATASTPSNLDADEMVVPISIDEWIGWDTAIYANGGLETQEGSINDQLGIKVKYHIMNDADDSSNALIKGDLMAAGYTTNRTAFLSSKFADAGLDVVMPVFTNYSKGGDGIIALNNITNVNDLVDAKVGVPKFSEAQTLVAWFVNKSDLSDEDKAKILENLVLMDDANQTASAFFSGNLDVAATWEPYLSQAEASTNSHILFDTNSSKSLVMDGFVFRADFAEENPEWVSKYIKGILQAYEYHGTAECAAVMRNALPMLADSSDEDIIDQMANAEMCDYAAMHEILTDTAPQMYTDMCDVWESLGETVNRDLVNTLFDASYLETNSNDFSSLPSDTDTVKLSDEEKQAVVNDTEEVDYPAMLKKTTMVTFVPDTTKFMDQAEAEAELSEFVEIAKILDGAIIKVEGNINSRNGVEYGQELSEGRAKTVAQYLIANGIDGSRIVTVGNDNRKPLVDPDAPNCELNRRTDISFISIEN